MRNSVYLKLVTTLCFLLVPVMSAYSSEYYVKPNGNDGLDGLSDVTAWKTISRVNSHNFEPGDDVYFKCGGTWSGTKLAVRWDGLADDRAVIGSYYVADGRERHGVVGNKPTIDGNDKMPLEQSYGLIEVNGQQHVEIENLKVINSEGHALLIHRGSYNNVSGVETANIYNAGIKFYEVDTGIIENCDIYETGRKRIESPGTDFPAAIAIINGSHNITIRKNTVHENYGEGIGLYHKNHDCLIEDNICFANKVNIYLDRARRVTIRRNLCYGTTDVKYHIGGMPGSGIGVNDESQWTYGWSQDNQVYGNLIAWCGRGIFFNASAQKESVVKNLLVYNNTVVDCGTNIYTNEGPYENSEIKNNISWVITEGEKHARFAGGVSGLTIDYNLWSSEPNDSDAHGKNDPAYAAPSLAKNSGWRLLTPGSLDGKEFALSRNSPAINRGGAIDGKFEYMADCDRSNWKARSIIVDSHVEGGSAWEIGADVHILESSLTPPTSLRIVGSIVDF